MRRSSGGLRRILLIKPDHLGDLLLATPALHALREALPDAHIVGLVGPWSGAIWRGNDDLDALLMLPFPGFVRGPGSSRASRLQPYFELLRYAVLLRATRYDAALLLRDDHWWGALLALLAGIPRRVGHAHPLVAPLLTTAYPYDPAQHVSEQALDLVALLGGRAVAPLAVRPPLRFTPTAAEQSWAAAWLAAHLTPTQRLVVLHPGSGGPAKHWSPERWATVARYLAARPDLVLLLSGGPAEAALLAEISALMARPPLLLVGSATIGQLAALLGQAKLVLGVDSGPLHIAVSQGTPTLHLFGPSDSARFGPWGDPARHRVISARLWCSPCGVFAACPRATLGPECMVAIEEDAVIAAVVQMLKIPHPKSLTTA